MTIILHIPMLAYVCDGIAAYVLPFSAACLWGLFDGRGARLWILAGLTLAALISVFGAECCCLSRFYPWDHLTEHVIIGGLAPLLCLLGYVAYLALCRCMPDWRRGWKSLGICSLAAMGVGFSYVYATFPLVLLGWYFFSVLARFQCPSSVEKLRSLKRRLRARAVLGVTALLCAAAVAVALLCPPLRDSVCAEVEREMLHDMAHWSKKSHFTLHSCRFMGMWRDSDGLIVKYYCETNHGPLVYQAYCNAHGGFCRGECVSIEL